MPLELVPKSGCANAFNRLLPRRVTVPSASWGSAVSAAKRPVEARCPRHCGRTRTEGPGLPLTSRPRRGAHDGDQGFQVSFLTALSLVLRSHLAVWSLKGTQQHAQRRRRACWVLRHRVRAAPHLWCHLQLHLRCPLGETPALPRSGPTISAVFKVNADGIRLQTMVTPVPLPELSARQGGSSPEQTGPRSVYPLWCA